MKTTNPFPNYIDSCSTNTRTDKSGVIRKIENTVVVPGFVAYPYLDDPFDDIDNQDKYLLHNYNNSPDVGFSFIFNGVNNYYSQFCKQIPFINGSVDINEKLTHSYNQQLFISIFNIINSYENQKDTIWNNINYLEYFYHLFPTHLNKFYSLFHKYVSPKIEQLKTSIYSFENQKSSINAEITSLNNAKQSIENLSKQITTNVDKLNNTISKHHEFKSLAKLVQKEITSKLVEIKEMNKTQEITKALEQKVNDIKQQAEEKLQQVNKTLTEHGLGFKTKIYHQVLKISPVLEQLYNKGRGKIKIMEDKIEGLIKIPKGSDLQYGSLRKLGYGLYRLRTRPQTYWSFQSYLDRDQRRKGGISEYSKRSIEGFAEKIGENWGYINNTVKALEGIPEGLRTDRQKIRKVIDELGGCTESEIDKCKSKIEDGISNIQGLKVLNNLEYKYSSSLEKAKEAIKSVNRFKSSMGEWDSILSRSFTSLVENIPEVKEDEIQQIVDDIEQIRNHAKTAQRYLRNTQKMFKYLTCVNAKNKEISVLRINGTSLEKIEATIGEVSKAGAAIKQANEKIKEAKEVLESGFEDPKKGGTGQPSNGGKSEMMPDGLDLNGKENGFQMHKTNLEEIRDFKASLAGITSGMRQLNGNSQPSKGSDVKGTLEWLEKIHKTLSTVYGQVNTGVSKMKGTYSKYQEIKLKGTGSSIQSYVVSIGQIPGKIAELQSKVKYNKVLLNIAKSVNETLNKVRGDAKKLKKADGTLKETKQQLELMTKRYECIKSNICILFSARNIDDLNKLKKTIEIIKKEWEMIYKNIKRVEINKKYLVHIISKIINYQKILFQISEEIAFGFSKIGIDHSGMPGVLTAHQMIGLGLHGFHGLVLPSMSRHLIFLSIRIGFIMAHLSWIRMKLEEITRSKHIESIEPKMDTIGENIQKVESSIESVIICFLKCSNESIANNTIESTKRMLISGGQVYNYELDKRFLRCLENMGCQYNI